MSGVNGESMRREFSAYLDATRFLAAMTVFISHLTFAEFTGGIVPYQGKLAGEAVAAFFVLSGYVISYVSQEKERTLRLFAVSRLARVYSVALPVIALTIVVDLFAMHFGWPRNVPVYQYYSFSEYLALAVTFTGQAGPLHESTFGSHTFWSLDYEVWYYLIFAAATYFSGGIRVALVATLLILSGPRVAIDFPMWLLGVGIYRLHQSTSLKRSYALAIFILALFLLCFFRATALDIQVDQSVNILLGGWPVRFLENSQEFASESVAAILVAITIFSANYLRLSIFSNTIVARIVTYLASFTFVLYLAQRSFLDLFAFGFKHNPHSIPSLVALICATLFSVWLLGFVTERRKLWWRSLFDKVLPGHGDSSDAHVRTRDER